MNKNKQILADNYNKSGKSIAVFQEVLNNYNTKFSFIGQFNIIYS